MSLSGSVLTILPTGAPSLPPAGFVVFGPGDVQEPAFVATFSVIGDGATTAVPVNWIDGTQTIQFTPKAVLAFGIPALSGSADSAGVLQVEGSNVSPRVTSIANTGCTVNYSTAIGNTKTASFLLVVYK